MSRDTRWSGGVANRSWQRGTPVGRVPDKAEILAGVRAYLADVRRYRRTLDSRYHPSADSAVKAVHGREDIVRAAYAHLTRG